MKSARGKTQVRLSRGAGFLTSVQQDSRDADPRHKSERSGNLDQFVQRPGDRLLAEAKDRAEEFPLEKDRRDELKAQKQGEGYARTQPHQRAGCPGRSVVVIVIIVIVPVVISVVPIIVPVVIAVIPIIVPVVPVVIAIVIVVITVDIVAQDHAV